MRAAANSFPGGLDRAMSWQMAATTGRVRKRQDGLGWYIDLRPHARIFTVPGLGRLVSRKLAEQVLTHIQGGLFRGEPIDFILATYRPASRKPMLVEGELERWLTVQRGRERHGDISPSYLRELERYAKPGGYLSWWFGRSVHEIQYGAAEEWMVWLGDLGLSPRTRRHARDALRTFLRWELRSRRIEAMPELPSVSVSAHVPMLLPLATQDAIIAAISEPLRGPFLVMARMGVRPGEVQAFSVTDYADGELLVARAVKGRRVDSPIRATKTGAAVRLPVWDAETRAWLDRREAGVTKEERLRLAPLFTNPRARNPERRWTLDALEREWGRACKQVGVRCSLYEGTKHSFATAMLEAGVALKTIQTALRHADHRSTEHYAKLRAGAVVSELSAASARARNSPDRKDIS